MDGLFYERREMILISRIEIIDTGDQDPYKIISMHMPDSTVPIMTQDGPDAVKCSHIIELVKGRRFVRPSDGLDVMIGCSRQAQDLIGIQYDAWKSQERLSEGYRNRIDDLITTLVKFRKASLWTRIKWVFSGIS